MNAKLATKGNPRRLLVRLYERNGYLRIPNAKRRKTESNTYKMGYEIRIVGDTKREIADIRRLIRAAGLKPGKPFLKHKQWVQPIYGRATMESFVAWIDEFGATDALAKD